VASPRTLARRAYSGCPAYRFLRPAVSTSASVPLRCGEMRLGAPRPVPNPVPSSHSVALRDDVHHDRSVSLQAVLGRSGVGVEPTYRWAAPVSPVLKLCQKRPICKLSLPGAPVGAPAGSRPCTHELPFGWVRRTLSFGLVAGRHSELLLTMEVPERHVRKRAITRDAFFPANRPD
jgi:hypothetical protein